MNRWVDVLEVLQVLQMGWVEGGSCVGCLRGAASVVAVSSSFEKV